ncbi:MAG TPA: cysteine desulfurase family protein [Acidimicrobiales bacterium]|jgi:cysteine desulfurase|nr:cysteine desulfurase family protein [Acidimicrobiales bacterium]
MTAYLDHAATTPLRPEALDAMLPYLTEHFGNPSGSHAVSRQAKQAIEEARDVVAWGLGCRPAEVVFTGGGTEADNLALFGPLGVETVACTDVEHHAVLHSVLARGGQVVPVADIATTQADLVSVMLANNETGVVHDLPHVKGLLHTDAVAAFPWLDVAALAAHADLVSISAHKFGGPKGVGALAVRGGVRLRPILHGGGQEADRRSGTHNVAGIVGMAAALKATVEQRAATVERVGRLRDRLANGLLAAIPGARETGERATKTAGNCHLRFPGVESESLLVLLDEAGVCASAGSACASGAIEPSHVLTAMGVPRDEALASVRLSLGSTTTDADVDLALKAVPDAVARLR